MLGGLGFTMPKGAKPAPPQQSSLQEMWGKRKREPKKKADEAESKPEASEPGPSNIVNDAEDSKQAKAPLSSAGKYIAV